VSGADYSGKKTVLVLFINGRPVDCGPLKRAFEAVYASVLPQSARPFIFLVRPDALYSPTFPITRVFMHPSCPQSTDLLRLLGKSHRTLVSAFFSKTLSPCGCLHIRLLYTHADEILCLASLIWDLVCHLYRQHDQVIINQLHHNIYCKPSGCKRLRWACGPMTAALGFG
jgi:hypothetical protein